MVTRAQVVAEARTWLGTPYRHQGRLKGVSVDCAGLVVCVFQAFGLDVRDAEGYSRRADGTLLGHCESQSARVPSGLQDAGDVAVFHWNNSPVHLGILTAPDQVLHAYAINRVVCEHRLDEKWLRQVACYLRVPGVE
jgi:NlpC/P60 family putative phage cell wall peptidase